MAVNEFIHEAWRNHTTHALFEQDITAIRSAIRNYRRKTNTALSLTTYMVYVFTQTINEFKSMQAIISNKRKFVIFEDVDCGVMIERVINGNVTPSPYIIRRADKKTLAEINHELAHAKDEKSDNVFTAGKHKRNAGELFLKLPGFVRRMALRIAIRRNPFLRKQFFGTCGVSALQMFANKKGWGSQMTGHNLALMLGGMTTENVTVNNKVMKKNIICLTLAMNHDTVDGAPAVRFLNKLINNLDNLIGLEDYKE